MLIGWVIDLNKTKLWGLDPSNETITFKLGQLTKKVYLDTLRGIKYSDPDRLKRKLLKHLKMCIRIVENKVAWIKSWKYEKLAVILSKPASRGRLNLNEVEGISWAIKE